MVLAGARSGVAAALGVVGVIVPWNYPLYLALGPLVDALAAGNRVLIKMSEYTPRTAAAVATLLAEALPGGEAQVALGEVALAQALPVCRLTTCCLPALPPWGAR